MPLSLRPVPNADGTVTLTLTPEQLGHIEKAEAALAYLQATHDDISIAFLFSRNQALGISVTEMMAENGEKEAQRWERRLQELNLIIKQTRAGTTHSRGRTEDTLPAKQEPWHLLEVAQGPVWDELRALDDEFFFQYLLRMGQIIDGLEEDVDSPTLLGLDQYHQHMHHTFTNLNGLRQKNVAICGPSDLTALEMENTRWKVLAERMVETSAALNGIITLNIARRLKSNRPLNS
jgi:hypothetical protein